MRILPSDYSALDLDLDSKRLVNYLDSHLDDEWLGLLNLVPLLDAQPTALALIQPRAGVHLLSIDPFSDTSQLNVYLQAIAPLWKSTRRRMRDKLLSHANLRQSDKRLRFPFSWSIWFPHIGSRSAGRMPHFILDDIFFHDQVEELLEFEEASASIIDSSMGTSLLQVIALEYSIPIFTRGIVGEEEIAAASEIHPDDYSIAVDDESVAAFRLTDEQINLVNGIQHGSQLILACAGSGKSVILISKAFKLASIHPEKQILITCFNSNLRNYYEWRIGVAGFRERNVECLTFHALCCRLLLEVGMWPVRICLDLTVRP